MSLREAASVVFGLAAVLPILLFVYLLAHANLLQRTDVQIGLFSAVAVSVLGFVVFRRMVGQIARLAEGFQAAPRLSEPAAEGDAKLAAVPGLGQVTEISQVTGAFYGMLEDLRGATQRLEDLVFKLGTLNETVDLAARIPRIQDLLGQVLQTTMRAVRATTGSIMILDRERQTLRLAASRGFADEIAADVEVRVGQGVAGKVAEHGEPVLADDVEADPRFRESDAARYGSGAFICMPIRAGDRVIGVINMAKPREASGAGPQPFSTIDLQFLNALMTYIGYAVDNARLLEEAQESARRLQAVVDDLKTTQEELVRGETLRAIGQLASGMAHHLNNLFAVILGRSELLLGSVESAAARRSLDIIRRSAQDGADVTRRVQRFSRLHPLSEPVAVDLNQLALHVVELTRPRWQDEALAGRRIEMTVEPGPVPLVVGELAPLREALMNLILNAVDAMPDGGQATIRTWVEASRVRCAVTDTGIGMSDEVRRRALQPFFTTKGPKSTGLGLSVAYGAVHRYGGQLEIDSELGRGTTVTISLPVAPERPVVEPDLLEGAAAEPAGGLRVLVIEDEAGARDALAGLLEEQGHTAVKVADGEEALGRLKAGEFFDLVLTDLEMPRMNGWDIARHIRQSWPQLPVGLIVGWGEEAMTREERQRVDLVVTRPFDAAQLRERLSSARARLTPPS
jgi:signal transduction histidine kinase